MGKANNNFKVVHVIGTSPGQVKLEDDHPAQATTMVEHSTSILSKYQEFSNIFEKRNVNRLSKHQSYDCPIDIQDGACPPFGLIYRLSEPELDTLHAYINENLMKGFIHHSKSTVGAPIPFVKQKGNDPQSLPTTFYSKAFGSPLARTSVLDN